MEAKAKLLAADLHFGNEVTTITNDEWVDYFQFAMDYHDPDFGDLRDKIRTTVVVDESEIDAMRRYDKWAHDYWALLHKNMKEFHTSFPKQAMKALIEDIRPVSLKKVIKARMDLDMKHLRNYVLQFMA